MEKISISSLGCTVNNVPRYMNDSGTNCFDFMPSIKKRYQHFQACDLMQPNSLSPFVLICFSYAPSVSSTLKKSLLQAEHFSKEIRHPLERHDDISP
mmetsp:Transcript_1558/g.3181  ORF Transcript_1558/g.3181 Transcript_1558/m.3181 type:complete len:97 (-) Transcript_1558:1216-1506(-)